MDTIALVLIFLAFSLNQYLTFKCTVATNPGLNEKQQAWILSTKNALTLFTMGLVFLSWFVYSGGNLDNEWYNGDATSLRQLVVLFFMSYLVMDCVLGTVYYHKYMLGLSGYFHHISYLLITCWSMYTGQHTVFLLFILEELPTLLLSVGNYNYKWRSDILFGVTFLLTRIVFHSWLTWYFFSRGNIPVFGMSVSVLGLHLYWFYNWILSAIKRRDACLETCTKTLVDKDSPGVQLKNKRN